MPIYEFECQKCHKCFSEKRKIEDRDNEAVCPDCGSSECHREISKGTDFSLQGKGWYKDGYQK